jgi:hypothetical protein
MRLFIYALAPVILAGSAAAQTAPLDKIYACTGITKADERLACFDAAVSGLKQAEATGGVAVVSKEQIAAAEKQSFGLAAPSLSEVTRSAAPAAAPPELDRVDVTIASVTKRPNNLLRITLSDGQVWEEFDNSFGRLSGFPLKAEIRKGALGGFMMKVGDKPPVRVRRVK